MNDRFKVTPLSRRDMEPRIVFPFDFCLGTLNEHVAFGLFTARPVAGDVRMTVKNRPLPLSALLPRRALQSIFPEATAAPVSLWAAPMSTTSVAPAFTVLSALELVTTTRSASPSRYLQIAASSGPSACQSAALPFQA